MTNTFVDRLGRELNVPDGYTPASGVVTAGDLTWWEGPPMFQGGHVAGWHMAEGSCEGHPQIGHKVEKLFCVIRKG
jgi:hypothetical protein